ncbi:hypothetical protein PQR34_47265 [Paraburkholderia sediminicola]|uniref:hypothetical protein n=1 Tax=Paraburkholderia sediminicola TaxID=458836 RepID=UPI0038BCEB31
MTDEPDHPLSGFPIELLTIVDGDGALHVEGIPAFVIRIHPADAGMPSSTLVVDLAFPSIQSEIWICQTDFAVVMLPPSGPRSDGTVAIALTSEYAQIRAWKEADQRAKHSTRVQRRQHLSLVHAK